MQVERFILEQVLPYYANSHTEASYCGGFITRLRREARHHRPVLRRGSACGDLRGLGRDGRHQPAGPFGVRAALAAGRKVRVIIGPYEHHSNILPWRECGADVIELGKAPKRTGPGRIGRRLQAPDGTLVICALSAASNVTGIVADVPAITRLVKQSGAKMLWDYAGGAPYLSIQMSPAADARIDAIVSRRTSSSAVPAPRAC